MPPNKKVKLNEYPDINLIWADDEVQLLLESVRNFETQKLFRNATLFDPNLLFSSSNVKQEILHIATNLSFNLKISIFSKACI